MTSIFNGDMNHNIKNDQVLKNRSIDEYKLYMFKQGINDFKFDDIPNLDIHDKLSVKNTDKQVYTNTSKFIRDEFYNLRNKSLLLYNDGMGINRFYTLLKDPQANVIEKFNGDCISRIGQNTTQLYKDLCN